MTDQLPPDAQKPPQTLRSRRLAGTGGKPTRRAPKRAGDRPSGQKRGRSVRNPRKAGRWVRTRPERTAAYGRQWNLFVKEMVGRAGGRCEECGRADIALQVHHRNPVSREQLRKGGGAPIPDNPDHPTEGVDVLCVRCHYKTRAPRQVADWMDLLDEWYPPGAPPD